MDGDEPEPRRGAIVKRRWEIIPRRGGRAVILATVGAIALGAPGASANTGQPGGQGDNQELAVSVDDDDDQS
ncbi:MAG: hypothetical protein ACJ75R_04065 [Solirubrobacterales bacterium]